MRVIQSFVILLLLNTNYGFTSGEEIGTEVEAKEKFHQFISLPSDLQLFILNMLDDMKPRLLISKTLFDKQTKMFLMNSGDERILAELGKAVDSNHKIRTDSLIQKELNDPFSLNLIVRLLQITQKEVYKDTRPLIRGILTQHVRNKSQSYRDRLIEKSMQNMDIQSEAIRIIRGCFPNNTPVIHSRNIPEEYLGQIDKAVLYAVWSANNRIIRTWAFPGTQLPTLRTISIDGGVDIIVNPRDRTNIFYDPEFEQLLNED